MSSRVSSRETSVEKSVNTDDVRLVHDVANGGAGLLVHALCERAAVGIGIDGDDTVVTNICHGHPQQGRDGRLSDAALAGEHGMNRVPPSNCLWMRASIALRSRTPKVAEVDQVESDRVEELGPEALRPGPGAALLARRSVAQR